ncbi:MAG: hypothetical protein C0496_16000 [Erythrobacter sp.]|nr:hypothetical protein [Erythrobacter sp.]
MRATSSATCPGAIVVLWDKSNIHRGPVIRAFLEQRLRLAYFPAYATELNPDEEAWARTIAELANGRPDNQGAMLIGGFSRS